MTEEAEFQRWTLIVVDHPSETILRPFAELMTGSASLDVALCPGLEAVAYHLRDNGRFVILIPTVAVTDLKQLKSFMSKLRGPISEGWVIPVALNRVLMAEDMRGKLKDMGFFDVVSSGSIKPTGLKRRLTSIMAIMNRRIKGERKSIESQEWRSLLKSAQKPRILSPLDLPQDCWLFRGADDVKKVNDTWIVNLMGPAPPAGSWERQEKSKDGMNDLWMWHPRADGVFSDEKGTWQYLGQRPVFSDFHWIFAGAAPKLAYVESSTGKVLEYFSVGKDGHFEVSSNSDHAKKKWKSIRDSVLKEYRIPPDKVLIDTPPSFATISNKPSRPEPDDSVPTPWRALFGLPPEVERGMGLFSRVDTEEKRKGYIKEFQRQKPFVTAWTRGQDFKLNSRVIAFDAATETLFLDLLGKANIPQLKSEVLINIRFRRGSMFFVVNPSAITQEQVKAARFLRFKLPESVYEVQRRNYVRYEVPQNKVMMVTIEGEIRPVTNLSAGGLAFLGDSSELEKFKKGTLIENVVLFVDSMEIKARAEVRWVRKLVGAAPGGDLSVGIQFNGLKAKDEQRISLYVLEEGFEEERK